MLANAELIGTYSTDSDGTRSYRLYIIFVFVAAWRCRAWLDKASAGAANSIVRNAESTRAAWAARGKYQKNWSNRTFLTPIRLRA